MALTSTPQELNAELQILQKLRKELHEAYIVEAMHGQRGSVASRDSGQTQIPPVLDYYRTVDGPTIATLKSPNYPFLLCEEAPPSYVPPPVPYDVAGAVELMNVKVLRVQEQLQERVALLAEGRTTPDAMATDGERNITSEEVLDFFQDNADFVELAWEVSSLQWFYRWVMSHSISHLINAREQLEYVLSEGGQPLPTTAEEIEPCIEAYPFSDAVFILEGDRKTVIAQERRRLRSTSRLYREHVSSVAVTAATSSYLTAEEKYSYQEFYNQSEHLLLVLNHALLVRKAKQNASSSVANPSRANTSALQVNDDAHRIHMESLADDPEVRLLADDALNALTAEHRLITALMHVVRERKKTNTHFEIEEADRVRSRTAQIAVYGCIVSDISLMTEQMETASEFLRMYEEWLAFHGFDSHDALMEMLSKRSGVDEWPVLSYVGTAQPHSHSVLHTTPDNRFSGKEALILPKTDHNSRGHSNRPTDSHQPYISRYRASDSHGLIRTPPEKSKESLRSPPPASGNASLRSSTKGGVSPPPTFSNKDSHFPTADRVDSAGIARGSVASSNNGSCQRSRALHPQSTSERQRGATPSPSVHREEMRHDSTKPSPGDLPTQASHAHTPSQSRLAHVITHVYFQLLQAAEERAKRGLAHDLTVDRVWMMAALRCTVIKLVKREWQADVFRRSLEELEVQLLRHIQKDGTRYEPYVPNACALIVIISGMVQLSLSQDPMGGPTRDIKLALQGVFGVYDVRREVEIACTAVEALRWGALLDALWFQLDPTSAVNGDLLNWMSAPGDAAHGIGFLRIAHIVLPFEDFQAVTSSVTAVPELVVSYATSMDPSGKAGETLSMVVAGHVLQNAASPAFSITTRYSYIRRVLAGLFELESKGLLARYACRVEESQLVSLADMVYFVRPDVGQNHTSTARMSGRSAKSIATSISTRSATSGHKTLVGFLPPAAAQLWRLSEQVGKKVCAPGLSTEPFTIYEKPISFSTIGLLVSNLMLQVAAQEPLMSDLYMTGETVREQASWEIRNRVECRFFATCTSKPDPIRSMEFAHRAMSIQRDSYAGSALVKRPSDVVDATSSREAPCCRFISPLMRHVDDYLSSTAFDRIVNEADAEMVRRYTNAVDV